MSRKPIYLDKNTVFLITVYTRPDNIEDMWVTDYPAYDGDKDEIAKQAAEQFIAQLDDRWTPAFLENLRYEIDLLLDDSMRQ